MTEYQTLNYELEVLGLPKGEFMGEVFDPVTTLVNSKTSSKPYLSLLLKYLEKTSGSEKEMIIRALSEKGNTKAVPYLVKMFDESEGEITGSEELILYAAGNALYIINDKSSYTAILEICKRKNYGIALQPLLGILARIKTDESFDILIEKLTDDKLRGHSIDALGKLGDKRAIQILEDLEVVKGKYEFKAKQTALRKLYKL
ncbi:HEAT repeat domain-containing protein [Gilvibacter sediminis]|uniref:HEAT repeat domain-containing protein n=1 Tax=Gilvibacter sediminis TaxID=379071 RepID=UPI0023508114|nr:HEAT repeat domain-containing protein [Gilvibacter sediminis]MDC7997699.1 HEAT repeat domain-containing protein [Gilvibacter sediminis]